MQNARYNTFIIVIPGFQKVKLVLEMIYRVYQIIYWVYQIEKNNILGISRICDNPTYSRQKFSGLSWMVRRSYIQDYPEHSGCVLTGLRIASKIMPPTFWSKRSLKTLSRQKEPRRKGRTEHKCKAGNKFSFRNKK